MEVIQRVGCLSVRVCVCVCVFMYTLDENMPEHDMYKD